MVVILSVKSKMETVSLYSKVLIFKNYFTKDIKDNITTPCMKPIEKHMGRSPSCPMTQKTWSTTDGTRVIVN